MPAVIFRLGNTTACCTKGSKANTVAITKPPSVASGNAVPWTIKMKAPQGPLEAASKYSPNQTPNSEAKVVTNPSLARRLLKPRCDEHPTVKSVTRSRQVCICIDCGKRLSYYSIVPRCNGRLKCTMLVQAVAGR
jgi:hypothetical protein